MPKGKETHVVEQDPEARADKLVDIAVALLLQAHDKITSAEQGGRGLALVGIGNALLAINCNLEGLAYPLVEVDALAELPDGDGRTRRALLQIALLEQAAVDCVAENKGMLAGDYVGEMAAFVRSILEGAPSIEAADAVLCVDCQAAHDHGPARCMNVTGCAVCVGVEPCECACCGGELVLAAISPEQEPRVDLHASCAGGALGVWCASHCPARVRRESDIVAARVDCAAGVSRCSEHCP